MLKRGHISGEKSKHSLTENEVRGGFRFGRFLLMSHTHAYSRDRTTGAKANAQGGGDDPGTIAHAGFRQYAVASPAPV
jgi:hypothetical protein